jgi:hypothetical protein
VQIHLRDYGDQPPDFEVCFSLNASEYPDDAAVYVEAYHRNTLQRFAFGTVRKIHPPKSTILDELDLSGPVLFRVRVVDQGENAGRLVAGASGLRPEGDSDEEQRSSLIVVRAMPMDEQVWKMNFVDGSKPELIVNSRIPDAIGQIKTNHVFQALVLPAALRETLTYYLWNEDEDEGSIQAQWIEFAQKLAGNRPKDPDPAGMLEWVDEAVEGFSKQFKLCELLVLRMEGD